jgi:hypothetical protein
MTMVENIVRPFTNYDALPFPLPATFPPSPGDDVIDVALGGSGGRSVTWTYDGSGSVILSDTNKYKEAGRKSTLVHVENPDDPDQFVEFCRADQVTLAPQKTKQPPIRTSSYDTSGGYHDLTGGQQPTAKAEGNREYSFQYPKTTACKERVPDKGCA